MEIIPVIDLMHGLAVHARHGRRESYQPLQSRLCSSPNPHAVIEGMLRLHPFRTLYLADLDALLGKPPQTALIAELKQGFPHLSFWVDRGLPESWKSGWGNPEAGLWTVLGSESLDREYLPLLAEVRTRCLLSLDFLEGRPLGPEELLEKPEIWPERLILMNLTRVGSSEGPDEKQARDFVEGYPDHRFVAAGGVRNEKDLAMLKSIGMAGVLLASALHSGNVNGSALRRLEYGRG